MQGKYEEFISSMEALHNKSQSFSLGEDTPATSSSVERTRENTDTNGMAPRACLRSLNFIRAEFMVAIL